MIARVSKYSAGVTHLCDVLPLGDIRPVGHIHAGTVSIQGGGAVVVVNYKVVSVAPIASAPAIRPCFNPARLRGNDRGPFGCGDVDAGVTVLPKISAQMGVAWQRPEEPARGDVRTVATSVVDLVLMLLGLAVEFLLSLPQLFEFLLTLRILLADLRDIPVVLLELFLDQIHRFLLAVERCRELGALFLGQLYRGLLRLFFLQEFLLALVKISAHLIDFLHLCHQGVDQIAVVSGDTLGILVDREKVSEGIRAEQHFKGRRLA